MLNELQNLEAWERLIQNRSLDGLELDSKDGRFVLAGLELPDPEIVRRLNFQGRAITELKGFMAIYGAKWHNLDFTGVRIKSLRLFDCEIVNCRFDGCKFDDLRVWGTSVRDSTFRGSDLRNSQLGAAKDGKISTYRDVDFTNADFRETVHSSARFERCIFKKTKLEKLSFNGSAFVDCRFEGLLSEVQFFRHHWGEEHLPPNEMINVDFSLATLRYVEFRNLTMDRVILPSNDEHFLITESGRKLRRAIELLETEQDSLSKKLLQWLKISVRWSPENQVRNVIFLPVLREFVDEEGERKLIELIRAMGNG